SFFVFPVIWLSKPVTGRSGASRAVLFVADFLQPIDSFAVELFLDGDVRHGGGWRCAMPMLLTRGKPNHIIRMNLLDRTVLALYPTATGCDDQGLTERMDMPCGAGARFECDAGTTNTCWIRRLEERV